MSKYLLAIAFTALSVGVFGQSPRTAVPLNLHKYSSLKVQGPFDVYITQGSEETITMEVPEEIKSQVIAEVDHGVLKFHYSFNTWLKAATNWSNNRNWWEHNEHIQVHLTVKTLDAVTVSGSGKAFFKDGLTANNMQLKVRGSGRIDGKVAVKTLHGKISGSGHIVVYGTAGASTVKISGSGNFSALGLETESSSVRVSGSGHADVNASTSVNAAVSGSAHIAYTGNATKITTHKSGSGVITKK